MRLSDYDTFVSKTHQNNRSAVSKGPRREELKQQYPYSAIVKGCYPEGDFLFRWCWQQFGPHDGKCGDYCSEDPACPLVLVTEYQREYKDHEGNIGTEPAYKNPGDHSHEGTWTTLWLAKTGYDYGYSEFFFKNEADCQKFVNFIPEVTLGELYDNQKAEGPGYDED